MAKSAPRTDALSRHWGCKVDLDKHDLIPGSEKATCSGSYVAETRASNLKDCKKFCTDRKWANV